MSPRTHHGERRPFWAGFLDPDPIAVSEPDVSPTDAEAPAEAGPPIFDPEDEDGPRLTLAEWIEREAASYRAPQTPVGGFLARHLDELARLIRWTGADTPAAYEDRIEVYEVELRARWGSIGFETVARYCRYSLSPAQ
jgi:hypothetical protein